MMMGFNGFSQRIYFIVDISSWKNFTDFGGLNTGV